MRIGEQFIYLEGEPQEFDLDAAQRAITPMPGVVIVAPDKPRETYGSLYLPQEASERERPDCGTVVCTGQARRLQSGELGPSLPVYPGERVLLRPCKGKWLRDFQSSDGSFKLPEVRMYGIGTARNGAWRLEDELVAVYRGGMWQPLYDWVMIKRSPNDVSDSGILIANAGSKDRKSLATVVNINPNYSYGARVGDTVIVDTHPNTALTFAYGDLDGVEILRQVSEDGFRQIYAIVDESSTMSPCPSNTQKGLALTM